MSDPWDPTTEPAPTSWPEDNQKIYERDSGIRMPEYPRCVIPVLDGTEWKPCPNRAASTHHRDHFHADNRPSNRLSTCGDGTTGHHGWIEANWAQAEDHGWTVSKYDGDPLALPDTSARPAFLCHLGAVGWFRLDDSYGITPTAPPEDDWTPASIHHEPGPGGVADA